MFDYNTDMRILHPRQQDLLDHFLDDKADAVSDLIVDFIHQAVAVDVASCPDKIKVSAVNHQLQHLELFDEAAGQLPLRMVEDLFRRALLIDAALVHVKHTVGNRPRKWHGMGDNHHGFSALGELPDNRLHLVHHGGVKGAGWLIEQDDLRVHRKGAGNCNALLLPAGKLIRIAQGFFRKPYAP